MLVLNIHLQAFIKNEAIRFSKENPKQTVQWIQIMIFPFFNVLSNNSFHGYEASCCLVVVLFVFLWTFSLFLIISWVSLVVLDTKYVVVGCRGYSLISHTCSRFRSLVHSVYSHQFQLFFVWCLLQSFFCVCNEVTTAFRATASSSA